VFDSAPFLQQIAKLCESVTQAPQQTPHLQRALIQQLQSLSPSQQQAVLEALKQTPITFDAFPYCQSLFYALSKDATFIQQLAEALPRFCSSLESLHTIIWQLKRLAFRDYLSFDSERRYKLFYQTVWPVYRHFVAQLKPMVEAYAPFRYQPKVPLQNVAILTPQFLGTQHSPSRQCLDLACELSAQGIRPHIINTNSLPLKVMHSMVDGFAGNVNPDFAGVQPLTVDYLQHEQVPVTLFSSTLQPLGFAKIAEIREYLEQAEIDAVICSGEVLLIQDFITGHLPSLFLTTGGGFPLVEHDYHWLWQYPSEERHTERLQSDYDVQNFGFHKGILILGETNGPTYTRKDLGLSEEAFVYAIVGNRLDYELEESFASICREILDLPQTELVIIGDLSDS
jgi:hypothetical protein